ncbi:hypothetical protein V5O48_011638 [Marasmius crinis-equi]|uniref:Peroxidase n=1 Tax=Marasmius crinis-equi TaxID=585013 RepID=A0ABR3F533_9AGAR
MKVQSFLSSVPLLSLLCSQALGYTWPSWTDELEDIMYLQSGMLRRGFHDGVSPCTFSSSRSPFRHGAAEWLRTAFHDAITHDQSTGKGGLDASLMYEMDRKENTGSLGLNATFGFFTNYQSSRASMADLLALGVFTSVKECGGPDVPFRAGRTDATGAGETGVPEPTTDLDTTKAQFAKAGFSTADMIAMVACGHSLGGVHGNDFPEITGNNSEASFPQFDGTTGKFDNAVATEYFAGNTTNVLVVGPHDTNSDMRVFTADNNATMRTLTDSNTFRTTCASILQRMIDTVPSSVTLTDPFQPIEVKPMAVKFSVTNSTTVRFEGYIRIRITQRQGTPPQQVTLAYKDRTGAQCETCKINARMSTFQGGQGLGFGESFQFYEFGVDLPSSTSISSFTIQYNDELHDNGGNGFPIRSEILAQPAQSCTVNATDMTIVAAVRNDRTSLPTYANLFVKQFTTGIVGAAIETRKVELTSTGKVLGDYTFFSGSTQVGQRSAFTQYDLVNGDVTVEFVSTALFQSTCPALPSS